MSASAHDHRERDLDSPEEIAEMVRRFYQDVAQDDLLGPMFNDVAQVDWAEHLPKLAAFWCRALLGLPGYQGLSLIHISEPTRLLSISYAVFCLKKKKNDRT